MAKKNKPENVKFAEKWCEDWCAFIPTLCEMKTNGMSEDILSARSFRIGHKMGQRRGREQVVQEIRNDSAN